LCGGIVIIQGVVNVPFARVNESAKVLVLVVDGTELLVKKAQP
jgi:hypothetical protein